MYHQPFARTVLCLSYVSLATKLKEKKFWKKKNLSHKIDCLQLYPFHYHYEKWIELNCTSMWFNISNKYAIVQVQCTVHSKLLKMNKEICENAKKIKIMKKCPLIMTSTIGIHFQSFITFQFTFMRSGNTVELVKSSPWVNVAPGLGWVFPLKVLFIYLSRSILGLVPLNALYGDIIHS